MIPSQNKLCDITFHVLFKDIAPKNAYTVTNDNNMTNRPAGALWYTIVQSASLVCIQDTQICRPLCATLWTICGLGTVITAGDAEDDVLSTPASECACLMYLCWLHSMHNQLSKSRCHRQGGQYDIARNN